MVSERLRVARFGTHSGLFMTVAGGSEVLSLFDPTVSYAGFRSILISPPRPGDDLAALLTLTRDPVRTPVFTLGKTASVTGDPWAIPKSATKVQAGSVASTTAEPVLFCGPPQ